MRCGWKVLPMGTNRTKQPLQTQCMAHCSWHSATHPLHSPLRTLSSSIPPSVYNINPISNSLVQHLLPIAKKIWGTKHLAEYKTTTLDFFLNRTPPSPAQLSSIKVPVKLIHGLDDVAYDLEYTEEQEKIMRDAGIDVSTETIPGAAHFVVVDYSMKCVSPLLFPLGRSHLAPLQDEQNPTRSRRQCRKDGCTTSGAANCCVALG